MPFSFARLLSLIIPIVRQLVEKNLNIFLEKPLAESLDSARKICDLLKDRSIVHAVGYMKAHNPVYERAREILSGGVLGKDILFRSTLYLSQVFAPKRGWVYDPKKSGGGIVANSTCHLLYVLYRLFGPLRSVCGQTRRLHSEQVEDAATALLEFGNGVAGTLDTSWSTPGYPVEQTEIFLQGSGGILEINDTRLRLNLNEGTGGISKGLDHLAPRRDGPGRFRPEPAIRRRGLLQRRSWTSSKRASTSKRLASPGSTV